MDSDKDKIGWTSYEPVLCTCIDTRVGEGYLNPVLILELMTEDEKIHITAFFNVTKTKKGGYSVGDKSKFAKLYRITIGQNPRRLKGKAHQLVKHFSGERFRVEYKDAVKGDGSHYFKAMDIAPMEPIETGEWFVGGQLKGSLRGRYKYQKVKKWKQTGNELEINWKSTGNELDIKNIGNPNINKASGNISNALKHCKLGVSTLTHTDVLVINDKERKFIYRQQENETYDSYIDRVINESL